MHGKTVPCVVTTKDDGHELANKLSIEVKKTWKKLKDILIHANNNFYKSIFGILSISIPLKK